MRKGIVNFVPTGQSNSSRFTFQIPYADEATLTPFNGNPDFFTPVSNVRIPSSQPAHAPKPPIEKQLEVVSSLT